MTDWRHCDEYIDDETQPEFLRRYLGWARLPASCKYAPADENWVPAELRPHIWRGPEPTLFADYQGKRVRVVMASRFGDVGVSENLTKSNGYQERVPVEMLTNFGDSA